MEAKSFIYWLQGYFELNDPKTIDEKTIKVIRNHINLVFKYEIDPSYSDDPKVQAELQAIHDGNVAQLLPTPTPSVDSWYEENPLGFPTNSNNEVYRC